MQHCSVIQVGHCLCNTITCVCVVAAFRPVSEEQILHSVKWNELDLQEGVTRLAKKLAEKRVFGPMLMARATVAGTNHSNYSNLPLDGIRYIEGRHLLVVY